MALLLFHRRGCWAALLLLSVAAVPARADFIPLGDLPGGAFSSQALGVSADGAVVVGTSTELPN